MYGFPSTSSRMETKLLTPRFMLSMKTMLNASQKSPDHIDVLRPTSPAASAITVSLFPALFFSTFSINASPAL